MTDFVPPFMKKDKVSFNCGMVRQIFGVKKDTSKWWCVPRSTDTDPTDGVNFVANPVASR